MAAVQKAKKEVNEKSQKPAARETAGKRTRRKMRKYTEKMVLPKASRATDIEPPERLRTMIENKSSSKEVKKRFALLEAKLKYPDKICMQEREDESDDR